jgi:hypothetical protein
MMGQCATALAALVALVLATAAALKVGDQRTTKETFSAMGFVRDPASGLAQVLFVGVVGAELATAVALIAVPSLGAIAGMILLAAFTAVLLRTARTRPTVRCACFGSTSQRPIGSSTFVRNGLLILGLVPAIAMLFTGGLLHPQWGLGSIFFGVGAALLGLVLVQLAIVAEDARARSRSLAVSPAGLKAVS